MSRYFPPNSTFAHGLLGCLGLLVTAFPLLAAAEVTLSTTVERISSAAPPVAPDPQANAGLGREVNIGLGTESNVVRSSEPTEVFSGDVLRYTIVFENTSTQDVAAGSVVITNPLPEDTLFLEGSATGQDTRITYSVDGETFGDPRELRVGEGAQARAATAADYTAIRWAYQPQLGAGESSEVSFELLIP